MLGLFIILSAALAPPDHESTPPAISPAAFRRWFDSAAEGRLVIPDDVKARASRYRYVFVGGLQVGMMQGYLAQNAKELRAKGVPPEAIHILNPSSHKTVVENAEAVRSELKAIAELGPEKLVLIAHSRGACDTLAFAPPESDVRHRPGPRDVPGARAVRRDGGGRLRGRRGAPDGRPDAVWPPGAGQGHRPPRGTAAGPEQARGDHLAVPPGLGPLLGRDPR